MMSRLQRILLQTLAAAIAFLVTIGMLLGIAYYYELYTQPAEKSPSLLALRRVTLIDPTTGLSTPDVTIIIGGDTVLSIQREGGIPKGAEALSAEGLVVLPALIDAAVYFEAPVGGELEYMSGEWAWEVTRSLPDHRRALLEAGITTVLDLGSGIDSALRTRALIAQGELAGPRLLTTGPILTASGGFPGDDWYPWRREETLRDIQTAGDGVRWVQELAGRGVDGISVSLPRWAASTPGWKRMC